MTRQSFLKNRKNCEISLCRARKEKPIFGALRWNFKYVYPNTPDDEILILVDTMENFSPHYNHRFMFYTLRYELMDYYPNGFVTLTIG